VFSKNNQKNNQENNQADYFYQTGPNNTTVIFNKLFIKVIES
jgi:hypothetical protein